MVRNCWWGVTRKNMLDTMAANNAGADVLCPIGGGFSEIVPEDECPERPHRDHYRKRRDNDGQSPDPRTLEAGTISGPTTRDQVQAPHNTNPNRRNRE
jgi:hypothetical protein